VSLHDFSARTNLVFGAGAVARVSELDHSAFVVTDPGVVAAGHVERTEALLAAKGIETRRFDAVRENPTEDCVRACREALGDWDARWLIAIGGGSSIDVAKGCAMLLTGGGRMRDYQGRNAIQGVKPPVIAIPTTAGTGSEVQSFALIGNEDTGQKMACGGVAPAIAILDPELTLTQPRFVTACTGLDALAHAVETAVTRARTPFSTMYSREAFRLVERFLPRVFEDPSDLEARGAMLRASAAAGIAIENSMLGAAHSMANPLTAHHGIAHGQAVGQMLPHVVRYNALDPAAVAGYAELARDARLAAPDAPDAEATAALVTRLEELVTIAGFEPRLNEVPVSAVETLAAEAAEQWTARFNPRAVDATGFRELFLAAVR